MFNLQKSDEGSDHIVFTPLPEDPTVAKPEHYNKGVSPYEVGRTMFGPEGLLKFLLINSIKYIQRYPFKYQGDTKKQLEDLIKARQSIETAIELHTEIYGDGTIRHG